MKQKRLEKRSKKQSMGNLNKSKRKFTKDLEDIFKRRCLFISRSPQIARLLAMSKLKKRPNSLRSRKEAKMMLNRTLEGPKRKLNGETTSNRILPKIDVVSGKDLCVNLYPFDRSTIKDYISNY